MSLGGNGGGRPLIELSGVHKHYESGEVETTVLRDVDLEVQAGEFVSVVGPSGSGKSTLLNLITGIDRPNSGRVVVAGEAVHELNENALARWRGRNVGVIFQFFQLLPTLTILENVILPMDFCDVFPRRERRERALELLTLMDIDDQAHKLPNALSGGQQQRAAIARALANDPPLIVGDEPTGNLDTETADQVSLHLKRLVDEGKTVILVTHDQRLSQQTHRVLHLVDGELHRDRTNGRESSTRPNALSADSTSRAPQHGREPSLDEDSAVTRATVSSVVQAVWSGARS